MIPIAPSTTLSMEKAAQLVQSLVELKDRNVDLPKKLLGSINAFQDAQNTFVKEIDTYLNPSFLPPDEKFIYENEDEIEFVAVKTIVELCPEFLATTNSYGSLPCHNVTSSKKYFKLFIGLGCEHNIGSKSSRGGLLIPDKGGRNALHSIQHPEIFEMLRYMSPPLFYIEDIQKYNLLHNILDEYFNVNLVKYFCELDPSCVNQRDRDDLLPIHYFDWDFSDDEKAKDIIQYLVQISLSNPTSNETIGGLFSRRPYRDDFAINHMVEEAGMEKTWDCIERAFSNHKKLDDFPCVLHQTIQHTPQYCSEVIKRFPNSVHVRDKSNMNRLPIHVALEKGMNSSLELEYLFVTGQEYLKDVDPVTKWPPFILAGMGTSCDLRVIFDLLRKHPEHVERSKDGSGYKYITL